jgi:hypothetical protein
MNGKKMLFILGGVLKGDCLHAALFLKKLKKDIEVTWLHGTYAKDVVQLLQQEKTLHITQTEESFQIEFTGNLNSVKQFYNRVNIYAYQGRYDIICNGAFAIFPKIVGHRHYNNNLQDLQFDFLSNVKKENVIGMQLSSCITHQKFGLDKSVPSLYNIRIKDRVMSFGLSNDDIFANSIDCRQLSINELVKNVYRCKLFIGIHSFITLLAFYLGVPVICCHFKQNLLYLSEFHKNCVDLVCPTQNDIEEAVCMLKKMYW